MMAKENWLIEVIECLKEISDIDFQERVWIKGEEDQVSSYDEVICRLFDDLDLLNSMNSYDISDESKALAEKLNIAISKIEGITEMEKLLSSEWNEVVEIANLAKKSFQSE